MTTKLSFKQSIIAGLYAAGAAAIINAILFLIFHATGVITDDIQTPNGPMTVLPVIMASIIPAIIASIIFFLFERFTNNGFKIFRIVTIVLVLLSLYSPFTVIPGVTMGYALVLCVMHLVVAAALLYFIGKKVNENNSAYHATSN